MRERAALALLPVTALTLAAGLFNLTAQPSVLELVAYGVYLVPVLALFLLPGRIARTANAPDVAADSTPVVPENARA